MKEGTISPPVARCLLRKSHERQRHLPDSRCQSASLKKDEKRIWNESEFTDGSQVARQAGQLRSEDRFLAGGIRRPLRPRPESPEFGRLRPMARMLLWVWAGQSTGRTI